MPQRNIKSVTAKADIDDAGTITAYASTFTREPDWVGDVVAKGAFADWLARMEAEGTVLPLLYNHDQSSLYNYIGTVTDIREDDHGLLFTASFDDTDYAQRARTLVKDGRLAKLSFAYVIRDQCEVELDDGRKANELRRLDVDEVSLVLQPCNPDTSVVDVKAGRRNSKADEDELRRILDAANDIADTARALIGEELADDADDADDAPDPDDHDHDAAAKAATEPDASEAPDGATEGGEGMAMPEGREVELERLDACKRILRAIEKTTHTEGGHHA